MTAYDDERFDPPAPVARVCIRHPDHGRSIADIPMLIDSGADATLLPEAAVTSLGIVGTDEQYQLVAFDGATSSSPVFRADLVFMKKTFRGRFLLINAEVGVIGRNVLNNVRLLLDGPALNWEERSTTERNA